MFSPLFSRKKVPVKTKFTSLDPEGFFGYTVKLEYKDHHVDPKFVVVVQR
jgi:hypothetical protein